MNEKYGVSHYNTDKFHSTIDGCCIIAIVLSRTLTSRRYYVAGVRSKITGCLFNHSFRTHRALHMFDDVKSRKGCFEKQEKIHCVSTNRYEGLYSLQLLLCTRRKGNATFDFRTMPSAFAGVPSVRLVAKHHLLIGTLIFD